MYPVSLAFKTAIQQSSRSFVAKVIINGVEYNNENVLEITLNEVFIPKDDFAIGATPAAKLELTLIDVADVLTGAIVEPFIGLEISGIPEYVPLGVFIVTQIEKGKRTTKLTCLDKMILLDIPFDETQLFPLLPNITIRDVALEACAQAGVTLATNVPTTPVFPSSWKGYTCRETIGFVASFMGGNARMNRQGELEIVNTIGSETVISTESIYSLKTGEANVKIEKLSCIVSDNITLTAGTGRNISFENPAMTQTQLNNIYTFLSTIQYKPFEMEWQGNPALEAGDPIAIIDANGVIHHSFIMEQTLKFKGGLSGTARAEGLTDTAAEYTPGKSPLRRMIERQVGEATEEISEEISGIHTAIGSVNDAIDDVYTSIGNVNNTIGDINSSINTINSTIDSINGIIDGKLDAVEFGLFVDEINGIIASKVSNEDFESYMLQTAQQISSKVSNNEFSSLWIQEADSIAAILEYEDFESYLIQTAQQISSKVSSSTFDSYMLQTAQQISSKVSNNEFSSLWIQEADSIAAILEYEDFESYLIQTAQQISSKVSSSTFDSYVAQFADEIALMVRGDGVIAAINLSSEAIKIQSSKVNLIGAVTVLSDISGNLGTITAGTMIGTTFKTADSPTRVEIGQLGISGYFSGNLVQYISYNGYNLLYGNGNTASRFDNSRWAMNYLDGSGLFSLNPVNGLYLNAPALFVDDVTFAGNVYGVVSQTEFDNAMDLIEFYITNIYTKLGTPPPPPPSS